MKSTRNTHRSEYTDDAIYGTFDVDMHLNIGDYLYLAMYITFVLPVILLTRAVLWCFALITGKTSRQKKNTSQQMTSHRIHALISKFF